MIKKEFVRFEALFNETGEIDSKLSEDFLNLVKDSKVHRNFFVVLSQLRSSSKFLKTKFLIDLLGKGFLIILDNSIENKLYDNVKNSIILSQTYYYNDEKNNKIYIFEYIKNNKYFKSPKFWRQFIDDMIKKEFVRFEALFNESNFNVEKNINITKKIKDKLNEVVFSQLLTYESNMKDFNIDKRIILKIIDEFIEKYNYLSKNNIKSLYDMISQNEVDIEKLKKEYESSLEDELNNDIKEEKQNNINNEEKNEIKNEKNENEKEENKNNENENNNINENKNENMEEKTG
jgi:hypothetical protein